MRKNLYRKLAFRNIKKNASMMLPYLFTCVTVVIFYYIVVSLSANKDLKAISGGNFTIDVMKFGSLLFAILSIFFLLYSNSFIMKRRKKELGLYHILGLEKKHIQKVLAWENNICAFATIVLGLAFGFIINPFLTAILSRAISAELAFSSAISIVAVAKTVFLFITIFILIFLSNLRQIRSANSLELLKGGLYGEKEPKTKWSLAILGAVLLAGGYILSWFVKNPKEDLNLIIGAIVCVLIATYLLFLAVSVVVLKMLRSKEHLYYKLKNFTLISGLLYRIKQNAIGLSNICILATATLFIMTITTSLYFGINNMLNNSYSKDISIIYPQTDKKEMADLKEFIDKTTVKYSVTLENETHYTGNKHAEDFAKNGTLEYFFLMPLSDYNRLTGEELTLSHDEVLFYSDEEEFQLDKLSFGQNSVRIAEKLKSFPIENDHGDDYGRSWLYIVTQDDGLIAEYFGLSDNVTSYYEFDLLGKEADKTAFSYAITEETYGFTNWSSMSKYVYRDSAIVRFGGLLFLGILISIILFAETALSIFYKQISEGFDDKDRFNILTKVGMNHKEIHSTIRRQILIVFFSPLLVALLHLTIALPMIMKLLKIAFLDSVGVIAGSGLICTAVFVLIYSLVFFLTEQAYRKIVTSPQK